MKITKEILQEMVRQEVKNQLDEVASNEESNMLRPGEADYVGDALVNLWNEGNARGINLVAMAEYIMNWGKLAFEDQKERYEKLNGNSIEPNYKKL